MSYKYNININKLIRWIIPQEKPRPKLVGLVAAFCFGLQYLYSSLFKNYAKSVEEHLSINPQVWNLEYHLNKRYDATEKRIYIENGLRYPVTFIYYRDEVKPKALGLRSENNALYLGLRSESGYQAATFRVRIPKAAKGHQDTIEAFIRKYRLTGRTFTILEI